MILIKDIITQQYNTADDHIYISKEQMLKILDAPELPTSLAAHLIPHELMNGPKKPAIKFNIADEEQGVRERVVFETRLRYEVELGQSAGPGFFRRLKLRQWQKRFEHVFREYKANIVDSNSKNRWVSFTSQIGDPSRSQLWCI